MEEITAMGEWLLENQLLLGVAESCTGGLLCAACTDIPGSSRWFQGGVVAYQSSVKQSLLHVSEDLITQSGVVSEMVALAMAKGVCQALKTDVGIGITGIAGPDGVSEAQPVGTICYGFVYGDEVVATTLAPASP